MTANPYQPPLEITASTPPRRWPYLGWFAPVASWLPAVLLVALLVPMFFEVFEPLRERGELPALTSSVMAAARLSRSLFHVPLALFLAGLAAGDAAFFDWAQRRRTPWLHKLWQAAICLGGIIAAVTIMIGLLLPIIGTSQA